MRQSCECPNCKRKGKPFIKNAYAPHSVLNHSLASPSSVARVMYQKYVNSIPLYRQEKDWEQIGIGLSRATMANWIIRSNEDHLMPIVNRLREELLKRDIIHCDETPVQVLKEDGKKPQTKSYMWLYCSGNDAKPPISFMIISHPEMVIMQQSIRRTLKAMSIRMATPVTIN